MTSYVWRMHLLHHIHGSSVYEAQWLTTESFGRVHADAFNLFENKPVMILLQIFSPVTCFVASENYYFLSLPFLPESCLGGQTYLEGFYTSE